MLWAPWLPPKNNTTGKSCFNFISCFKLYFCSSLNLFEFTFVGVPVTTIFLAFEILSFASSKPSNISSAFLAITFTATPGKALLSCNIIGIFNWFAAIHTETHIYPPVPMTISGLNSFNIFLAWPTAFMVLHNLLILSKLIFLLIPYASTVFSS